MQCMPAMQACPHTNSPSVTHADARKLASPSLSLPAVEATSSSCNPMPSWLEVFLLLRSLLYRHVCARGVRVRAGLGS
jgi:hypothetical protein